MKSASKTASKYIWSIYNENILNIDVFFETPAGIQSLVRTSGAILLGIQSLVRTSGAIFLL